jgi:fluoride exporter
MAESLAALPWVALGGAIGGPARFFISGFAARRFGETFPWGTLLVNATGAFAIGLVSSAAFALADPIQLFVVTGVLGSYTTVSSFSLQTLALAREGQSRQAALNVALSLGLCLAGVICGAALGAMGLGPQHR